MREMSTKTAQGVQDEDSGRRMGWVLFIENISTL
jgi:hypothetical protein